MFSNRPYELWLAFYMDPKDSHKVLYTIAATKSIAVNVVENMKIFRSLVVLKEPYKYKCEDSSVYHRVVNDAAGYIWNTDLTISVNNEVSKEN